ncbi:cytochrome P450 [Xylariaceae sp. FL0255]|nr:cytochrome P450 [Xylariaceae sp. FL0255]
MLNFEAALSTFGDLVKYLAVRCINLLYFHPLSQYPGPKVAAVSIIWYAYHWLSGRYPWAVEEAIKKYGDAVRIAPNELVFMTPQAFDDIHTSHIKHHETFIKTDINDRGDDHGGIANPRSHTSKEPTMHKYVDLFIERMETMTVAADSVNFADWSNWLAMDVSAELTYNCQMNQLKNMQNSLYLDVVMGFNKYTTIEQVSLRFPLLKRFKRKLLPLSTLTSIPEMIWASRAEMQRRLSQGGNTEYPDFFEQLVPINGTIPNDPKELRHLEQVAAQLLFAGYQPVAAWLFGIVMYLLAEPHVYKILCEEIRGSFHSYDELVPKDLASLPFLNAVLQETLRIFPISIIGLPRISPGVQVDGSYIPQRVYCQTSLFARSRSPKYFHEPLKFRPQRFLPSDHPLYEDEYSGDDLKNLHPFNIGPRACIGKEVAWRLTRLFMAKMLWKFDLVRGPGRELQFERDFIGYGFWIKPELKVRFERRGEACIK